MNHLDSCQETRVVINSLWPSDTIWQCRSGSTWTQIMVCCLTVITWSKVVIPSKVFCDIHLRAISQVLIKLIHNKFSKLTFFKLLPPLPEGNEIKYWYVLFQCWVTVQCTSCTQVLAQYYVLMTMRLLHQMGFLFQYKDATLQGWRFSVWRWYGLMTFIFILEIPTYGKMVFILECDPAHHFPCVVWEWGGTSRFG